MAIDLGLLTHELGDFDGMPMAISNGMKNSSAALNSSCRQPFAERYH